MSAQSDSLLTPGSVIEHPSSQGARSPSPCGSVESYENPGDSGRYARILAISGASCSGKTTLAKRLRNRLAKEGLTVHVIHVDDHGVPRANRKHQASFEDPENVNWTSLAEAVVASATCADVLIVEGFCLLDAHEQFPSLHGMVHALIWLDTTRKLVIRHRALTRYPRGHWHDMEEYVQKCLWPAHEDYKRRSKRDLDPSTRVLCLSAGDAEAHMCACYGSVRRWAFGAASVNQRIIGSVAATRDPGVSWLDLSLIHISEPTRPY